MSDNANPDLLALLEDARKEIMYWTGGHDATSTESYMKKLMPRLDSAIESLRQSEAPAVAQEALPPLPLLPNPPHGPGTR